MIKLRIGEMEMRQYGRGEEVLEELGGLWQEASELARRSILWDVPYEARREYLWRNAREAAACAFLWAGGKPLACCWLAPLSGGSCRVAALHLFLRGAARRRMLAAARVLLFERKSLFYGYDSLFALVPRIYRPAEWLLQNLDFRVLAELPDCCHMADSGQCLPGRLWFLQRLPEEELRLAALSCPDTGWPDGGGFFWPG